MRFLKSLFFIYILFIVLNVRAYAQTAADSNYADIKVKQQQIQQILSNWRAHQGIPSATLSIYMPGHDIPITFASGTTTYGGGDGINDNTLYQIGSVTKSFTSAIILKLESEGKLNINDPISKYFPQYLQWGNITIRELLNHTSGIYNYTEAGIFNQIRKANPRAEFTPAELVRIASEHRDYFPPGKGWKYSNTNYVLAGMIIEKVTGKPMGEVMNYYLHHGGFPIHLTNTYFAPGLYTNSFMSRMAHGYSTGGADTTYDNMSWAFTVGGIVGTTQDLLTWWHGLFQGNILPPQQMSEMMSLVCESSSPNCTPGEPISHIAEDGIGKGYGLGIIQNGYGSDRIGTVWWHNGTTRGYMAMVMWFPKSDIYMAFTISRNPGYFLKPNLPIIRNVLSVLIPNVEWHQAHPKPQHHYFIHHNHNTNHHHRESEKKLLHHHREERTENHLGH